MSQKKIFHNCAAQIDALVDFLRKKYQSDGYEVQVLDISDPEVRGKYFSAKAEPDKKWVSNLKKWTGMSSEGTAKLVIHGADLEVEVVGKWLDKAAAVGVSMVVLWPLFVTGSIGAWNENKLLGQLYADIVAFLSSSQSGASGKNGGFCVSCGAALIPGAKFCGECGCKQG